MLIKLMKYDLMYSKNIFLSLGATIILASLIFTITFANFSQALIAIFSASLLLGAVGISSQIIAVILIYQNFSKNLFKEHGYFMLTLPINPMFIVSSKIITSLIWLNFMVLVGIVVLAIVIVFNMIAYDTNMVSTLYVNEIIAIILFIIVNVNVVGFLVISTFFAGISLSNSSINKYKLNFIISTFVSVIYLVVWGQVLNFISTLGTFRIGFIETYAINFQGGSFVEVPTYVVHYDILFIVTTLVFSFIAVIAILKLLKRVELL